MAAEALESAAISLEAVHTKVKDITGRGASSPRGHIPFTPRAKRVLELSLREALDLGHNEIDTGHILLGLAREGEGVAAQVLVMSGADLSRVRERVILLFSNSCGSQTDLVEEGQSLDEPTLSELLPDPSRPSAPHAAVPESQPIPARPPSGDWSAQSIPTAVVLPILYVLIGLLALAVDRPPTGVAAMALILLIGGVVGSIVAGWTQLVGQGHPPGLHQVIGRWSVPVSATLFAGAAVLILLDAINSRPGPDRETQPTRAHVAHTSESSPRTRHRCYARVATKFSSDGPGTGHPGAGGSGSTRTRYEGANQHWRNWGHPSGDRALGRRSGASNAMTPLTSLAPKAPDT